MIGLAMSIMPLAMLAVGLLGLYTHAEPPPQPALGSLQLSVGRIAVVGSDALWPYRHWWLCAATDVQTPRHGRALTRRRAEAAAGRALDTP